MSHDTATKSPLLENYIGTVHNFLFGVNGERASKLYPLLTAYAISLDSSSVESSTKIIAVLVFLQKAVDINSTAKVTEPLHQVVESLNALDLDRMRYAADARHVIERIRSRMGLGKSMSSNTYHAIDATKEAARFELSKDLPGELNPHGPRHDNDHVDIAKIQILPTLQEIESSKSEYLPTRDPKQLHKSGLEGLVDRHFRLVREDTVGQLRDAVQAELLRLKNPQDHRTSPKYKERVRKNIYTKVCLEDIHHSQAAGLQARVSFDQPGFLRHKDEKKRRQWWEGSKSLCADSLVCVLSTSGKIDFMCICIDSRVNDEAAEETRVKRLVGTRDRGYALLRLVEPHEFNIVRLIESLSPLQGQVEVCEFPGVLLPSFYPTLRALQTLSLNLEVPFSNLIAPDQDHPFNRAIPIPRYAEQPGFRFSLKAITDGVDLSLSAREKFDYKELQDHSPLDPGQLIAVTQALTRALATIQGPPGTGKSYTGVALIKVLLDNAKKAKLGPIICVCYTNHALDQLLEHLVEGGVGQIIRIGSRSKSEVLKPLNLREVAKGIEQTTAEKKAYAIGMGNLESAAEEVQKQREAIKEPGRLKFVKKYLRQENTAHFNQIFSRSNGEDERQDELEEQSTNDLEHLDLSANSNENNQGWQVVKGHDRRNDLEKWLKPKGEKITRNSHEINPSCRTPEQLTNIDLWSISLAERQSLHTHWQREIKRKAITKCTYYLDDAKTSKNGLDRIRHESDLRCLNQANVIGLTTSGLARNLSFLRHLRSKVLVCEEAGEVLEAHLLTALLPSIEHAILIGDHQQLRPQIQNWELQSDNPRGKQYSLDVSLFERLVQPEVHGAPKLPLLDLTRQRRMHPLISNLIRKTQYPDLEDDSSVHTYPLVEGVASRLFWIDHQFPENGSNDEDTTSYSNDHEIDMTAALVSHLVRQGKYESNDIAVLTPYLGQFLKLRRKLASSFAITIGDKDKEEIDKQGAAFDQQTEQSLKAQKGTLLQTLRIATVDNFQGEEAKVVIVSLVRSNAQQKCGFLRTPNRINVLLSRAQHGMYLIGDADTYRNIKMWDQVIQMLDADHLIGPALQLCCPRHPNTLIEVTTPDEFSVKAPEGGCDLMCEWRLDCGHNCINKCHSKVLHANVYCQEPCPRTRKGCDHPCERKCGDNCGPCLVDIPNVLLPCGHVAQKLPCHIAQNPKQALCGVLVNRTVSGCGHTIQLPCHVQFSATEISCPATCEGILSCGHTCTKACHECSKKDDGKITNTDHGTCTKVCGRQYNTCGHCCTMTCHQDEPCPLCIATCEVRCEHSRCNKRCHEPCAPCSEQCTWTCPHQGRCALPCSVPCSKIPCSKRCEKLLDCGHQCPSMCGEDCPGVQYCQKCCNANVKEAVVDYIMSSLYCDIDLDQDPILVPSCGHMMTVSNMDGHLGLSHHFEQSNDGEPIALKGISQPFSSKDLKNCPICRSPIRNINRYNRIIRRGLIDEATKKYITWSNTEFAPLAFKVQEIESGFANGIVHDRHQIEQEFQPSENTKHSVVKLSTRNQFLNYVRKISPLRNHFRNAFKIQQQVRVFEKKVSDSEQPFGRIWDLVQNDRRRKGASDEHFPFQADVLQPRSRLLGTSLAIRCDLAIIAEFLNARSRQPGLAASNDWRAVELNVDFDEPRQECLKLAEEAASKYQPLIEVEARMYCARFTALECSVSQGTSGSARTSELRTQALKQLDSAMRTSDSHPGQVRGLTDQIEAIRRMLNDGVFYSVVTSQETQEVYKALSREFRGTGHWYRCVNGHPFTIGECGMPMETSRCPQCGAQVGGEGHRTVAGVTRDTEMEQRMGGLTLGH